MQLSVTKASIVSRAFWLLMPKGLLSPRIPPAQAPVMPFPVGIWLWGSLTHWYFSGYFIWPGFFLLWVEKDFTI